jgi:DNA polymerase-3 subunit epsilon
MELLSEPIATAEFMVVDTETNGLAGEDCELTEVGAVLVGGGELHDRWSSLCRTSAPLRRGIQRLTGITQAMVDGAPSLEDVLPTLGRLMQGRVLVAHNAPFDRRVLRQAFGRIGLPWPDPPVLCTAGGACRCSPTRSGSRCMPSTGRWLMPRHAPVSCARCFRGCAPTRPRSGTPWPCLVRGGALASGR